MTTPTRQQPLLTVTGSIDDVLAWVAKMGERGIYNKATARFKQNAIEQMVTVLGPEEPRTAVYLKENIDAIAHRWTTKENANPVTAKTYKSRAFGAVTDYLAYQENPNSLKPRVGPPRGTAARKAAAKKAAQEAAGDTAPPSAPPQSGTAGPGRDDTAALRTFPLGKDREPFVYALPEGMVVADVIKIACHLVTLAEDFDPMNANTAAVFSLARREPRS